MKNYLLFGAAALGVVCLAYSCRPSVPEPPVNEIKIATFNIQTFGKTKCSKKEVTNTLTKIVKNFDIVAIQEIKDEATLPYFVTLLNESSQQEYDSVSSTLLGRTPSKEKYAFVYNKQKIQFTGKSYAYNDKLDIFERDPFVAQFKSNKFDFVLANIHIKPSDAKKEIANLVDVVDDACKKFSDDKDIIVLGDYNADGSYFSESTTTGFRDLKYFWAIPDDFDTTIADNSNTYDRIVFQKKYTKEDFTGNSGVFKFDNEYNLTKTQAKQVSDHYPVWCEFYTDKDTK